MGRAASPPEYRDDPDAVSLHTTPDDYNYDDAPELNEPPSYADSEADAASRPLIHHAPPPTTRTDHNSPSFRNGKPQACTTSTYMDARFDNDPAFLEDALRSFASTAPVPLICIMGTHKDTTKRGDKKENHFVTDFRIVLNISSYLHPNFAATDASAMRLVTALDGEKTHRGTVLKKRAPGFKQDIEAGTQAPTLTEWCHRFCASTSALRIFRLKRAITGLDRTYLSNRLEGLIRSTNYRGYISITFPIMDENVDIYTSHRVNSWRNTTWICWVFYLTFLWIITWPILFFCTKRFSVVRAEWPFSITSNGRKIYTTVSEEQYFDKWAVAIKRLALDRYQGEASEERMRSVNERPADPPMPGMINSGHAGVDDAVGLLNEGLQVARALSSGSGHGLTQATQGGWGYDA
ncbi:uncharacterized protein M421DRAFT_416240 [Didymella exigua CBS 183.55]|uniref:Uncharacterized protein n=1 Tax=Didymella exigua CBS 183.55 TaxID=1150837 RepID=A0A6A5RVW7_9PLEO|nr:uncharacterized protein M421DRAFT_416240 [Didymella exigua CBS 183.55]KAF1932621.1 hypothetical protein M421DRAFT_416240 [Didymella exigua CBS 183.55]